MLHRLKPWAAPLIFALLTLLFFYKIILTNLILVGVDVFLYFYPYKAFATEALRNGHLPLWNPNIFMGVPFLANSQVGLLYPPNWLLLWASPPKQVAYSIGLHIFWGAWGAYLFARHSLRLGWGAALVGGLVFGFSGFLGAQVEHLNQLQVSAWLPWLWLLNDLIFRRQTTIDGSWWVKLWAARHWIALQGIVIALMLLAGHTQSVYISLFGLGIYVLLRRIFATLRPELAEGEHTLRQAQGALYALLRDYLPLVAAIVLALLIAAPQLLPTAELTGLSIRSDGLTYNEVVSFSLNPLKLPYTIFPPYGVNLEAKLGPAFSEFVAYIGLIPLGLAGFALYTMWQRKTRAGLSLALTGGLGLLLAFGLFTGPIYYLLFKLVPGFSLFRVPARWLLLYTFAAAMLAAIGFARLKGRRWRWALPALLTVELLAGSWALRYNQPTAPEAYSFLRPAIVQLQAAQSPTDRFLSLSGIVYDPGDLREIEDIFADQLPPRAVYDYTVAAKQKEVLFFNLPMVFGLNAIDGYDGGLLPLKSFINLQRLFLPADDLSLDGRLREKLTQVPPGRLLSLLGVRHIVTDKVYDVWLDDIFYDLQFPANLQAGDEVWSDDIPNFPATAIGAVFHSETPGEGGGRLLVRLADGQAFDFALRETAGEAWPNEEFGVDYNQVFDGLPVSETNPITAVGLRADGPLTVRGVSLIEPLSRTSRSLLLTTAGRYRTIHGGDVKIYENLDVFPRAFIIHRLESVADVDAAVARLRDPGFDLRNAAVRITADAGETRGAPAEDDHVIIDLAKPETLRLTTETESAGWLVVSSTNYPGWQATIDGEPTPIIPVNLMLQAIELPAGRHTVQFNYRPTGLLLGLALAGLGLVLVSGLLVSSLKRDWQ